MLIRLLGHTLLLCLLLLALAGCSITRAVRVEDRQVIDVKTMMAELKDTPVVFVGERHDEPSHHELQLEIIKAKKAQGKELAIGMEMFEFGSQRALDAWTDGKVPELAFRNVFEWNWRNMSWDLYRDILVFARDNGIPVIALNAPREVVQKVSKTGFASLTKKELDLLPEGINAEVSDSYLDFIRDAYTIHGRRGDAFRFICEAQMLRNKVMARLITDYLELHPATSMVVLAGGGHARERGGVPAELRNVSYKVVLPPLPDGSDNVTRADADYLLEEPIF